MSGLYIMGNLLTGAVLGLLYLAGLRITVDQLASSRHPHILALLSFSARIALCLAGFWLASSGRAFGMVFCLIGFYAARQVLLHITVGRLPARPKIRENA
ncbi:MAG: ATP synthase subunit I [Desulfatibacillaceae bacterium]|nr:ATP synthase subunit I [Desulfatibacillaceae bacterium]